MKLDFRKLFVFLVAVFAFSSCVKEEYDFDKMDMTIKLGGDKLAFPLGSIDTLRISSLLDTEESDILQKFDGMYAFRLNDSLDYDISSNLPDLEDKLKIEGKEINKEFDFTFGDLTPETFRVPAIDEQRTIDPGFENIVISDISFPVFDYDTTVYPSFGQYKPSESQLAIDDINVELKKKPFNIPSAALDALKLLPDDPVSIPSNYSTFSIDETKANFIVEVELPDGVSNVDNIVIGPDAVIEITMEIISPILSSGSVNPDISLNPSDIFVFGTSTPLELTKSLNSENQFKAEYSYGITELNIKASDWTGSVLNLTKEVSMDGDIALSGATVSKVNLEKINDMEISVKAVIKNLTIVSADVDFPAVSGNYDMNYSIDLPPYTLPDEVKEINVINLKSGSFISMNLEKLKMENLTGVNITGALEVTFPDEIIVSGADADNTVTLDISIPGSGSGSSPKIPILGIDLSRCTPVNGVISLSAELGLKFNYSAGGRVSTEDIAIGDNDKAGIKLSLSSDLQFDNASIVTNDIRQSLGEMDFDFSVEVPDDVSGYGKITVEPKGAPAATFAINLPELPLDLVFDENGMYIQLPSFIKFKDVPSQYNYNLSDNSITIKGAVPASIILPIDEISAEAVEKNGLFYFDGAMSVSGGLVVESGTVNTSQISGLSGKTIGISVTVPEIEPNTVSMSSLKFDINEIFPLPIEVEGIEEIYSIDSILVKGAELSVNAALLQFPDIQSPIQYDFYIDFPDSFIFDDDRISETNILHITGAFSNGEFDMEPIDVKGLTFDGKPLGGTISINDTITIRGSVMVDNPVVTVSDLSGKPASVNLVAAISDFSPVEMYGKIDYPMDPVTESLSLTDIPDFLRSESCVLDVENPHIALTLNSNVGIPIDGVLMITPYINSSVNLEGVQIINIKVPKCEPGEEERITKYWIAKDRGSCPDGYVFLESNLAALIKRIPDMIEINLVAQTDLAQQHYLNVETHYAIEFNYDLVVPLMFGEDLQISISDTISGIPDFLAATLARSNIVLGGTIENTLPLQLELKVSSLDSNYVSLPVESSTQVISACNSDGSAHISDLDIVISSDGSTSAEDIEYMVLSFKVTSPNASGVPITDASYVRADINVLVDGGIIIEPDDEDEEEDDDDLF